MPHNKPPYRSQKLPSSADGHVRITLGQWFSLDLNHYFSELSSNCLRPSPSTSEDSGLKGITEWLSGQQPKVSLSWDWGLIKTGAILTPVMIGEPFTNIRITDHQDKDLPITSQHTALIQRIEQLPWQSHVSDLIQSD